MSPQQIALETCSKFHVVGIRSTGERVNISEHDDQQAAERTFSLMQVSGTFSELFIECDGKQLLTWGFSAVRDH